MKNVSLSFGVYHLYTTDVIERISVFEDNVNIFMPFNIGTNRATGVEFNFKYTPSRKLTITGDFNYNGFNRLGSYEGQALDFSAERWSSRLRTKLRLPLDITFELTGRYRSGFKTIQGFVSQNAFMDLGLRKKLMKGKLIANFGIRDIFASRIREVEVTQENFSAYSFGQRGRFITLGVSYGFGKGEAMEFSSGRRRR